MRSIIENGPEHTSFLRHVTEHCEVGPSGTLSQASCSSDCVEPSCTSFLILLVYMSPGARNFSNTLRTFGPTAWKLGTWQRTSSTNEGMVNIPIVISTKTTKFVKKFVEQWKVSKLAETFTDTWEIVATSHLESRQIAKTFDESWQQQSNSFRHSANPEHIKRALGRSKSLRDEEAKRIRREQKR